MWTSISPCQAVVFNRLLQTPLAAPQLDRVIRRRRWKPRGWGWGMGGGVVAALVAQPESGKPAVVVSCCAELFGEWTVRKGARGLAAWT